MQIKPKTDSLSVIFEYSKTNLIELIEFLKNCEVIYEIQNSTTKTLLAVKGSVKNKN